MDFTTRSGQARPAAQPQPTSAAPAPRKEVDADRRKNEFYHSKWFRLATVTLLFSGTILVVAVLLFLNRGNPSHEDKFIDKNGYQAISINTRNTAGADQVYFGHIDEMTNTYVHLSHIFYIQPQASTAKNSNNNTYSLVKLGCELTGPKDEMVINRDQVFYWENLKSDGQVSQKIAEWYKNNPNGQKCDSNNSTNSTQQGGSNTTPSSNSNNNTNSSSKSKTSNDSTKKQ